MTDIVLFGFTFLALALVALSALFMAVCVLIFLGWGISEIYQWVRRRPRRGRCRKCNRATGNPMDFCSFCTIPVTNDA